jgi:hypothetical protein
VNSYFHSSAASHLKYLIAGIACPPNGTYRSPKNQVMWVHSEQTKQVALRLAQSRLKKVAMDVFSWARLVQKLALLHTGHLSSCPFTSMV